MKAIKIKIQIKIESIEALKKIAVYWFLLNSLVQIPHEILRHSIL